MRLVAVPTTAGTGSEVSPAAVLTAGDRKVTLVDYSLVPDMAVVDPTLTLTMPPELTADTGVDALTHALEAYVSIFASPYTDAFCLQAIHLILDALPRAYADGSDLARPHRHGQRRHDRRARVLERVPRRQPRARARRRRALRRRPRPRQRHLPARTSCATTPRSRRSSCRRPATRPTSRRRSTRRSPGCSGSAGAARTPRASGCSRASTSCWRDGRHPALAGRARGSRPDAWDAAVPGPLPGGVRRSERAHQPAHADAGRARGAARRPVTEAEVDPGFALAIVLALAFAVTNGLHDASNAIAALVATRAARPLQAVAARGRLQPARAAAARGGGGGHGRVASSVDGRGRRRDRRRAGRRGGLEPR